MPSKRESIAVIAAAGTSRRMGEQNKLFLEINGKTVIYRSCEAFAQLSELDRIVIICHPQARAQIKANIKKLIDQRFSFILGGASRQESVYRALTFLEQKTAPDSIVLIHDAARCLVSRELILNCLEKIKREHCAVAPARRPIDSLMLENKDGVLAALDRSKVRAIQTPQGARLDLLKQAHQEAIRRGLSLSDDLSALEEIGYPIRLIEGSFANLKITYPEDLALLAYIDSSNML